jgi:hypothetical protein
LVLGFGQGQDALTVLGGRSLHVQPDAGRAHNGAALVHRGARIFVSENTV